MASDTCWVILLDGGSVYPNCSVYERKHSYPDITLVTPPPRGRVIPTHEFIFELCKAVKLLSPNGYYQWLTPITKCDFAHTCKNDKRICLYFPHLGAFAKLRKAIISFVMSVRLSVRLSVRMEQVGSH